MLMYSFLMVRMSLDLYRKLMDNFEEMKRQFSEVREIHVELKL